MASSCHYSALTLSGKQAVKRQGGCANREVPLQTQHPPPVDSRSFPTAARASPAGCAGGLGYPAPDASPCTALLQSWELQRRAGTESVFSGPLS